MSFVFSLGLGFVFNSVIQYMYSVPFVGINAPSLKL